MTSMQAKAHHTTRKPAGPQALRRHLAPSRTLPQQLRPPPRRFSCWPSASTRWAALRRMRNAQRSRKCRCWVRQDETASSGWLEQQRKLHALDLMLAVRDQRARPAQAARLLPTGTTTTTTNAQRRRRRRRRRWEWRGNTRSSARTPERQPPAAILRLDAALSVSKSPYLDDGWPSFGR